MDLENRKPNQVGIAKTSVFYYDANGLVADPIRSVKKVTRDYDSDGNVIKTFTELSISGFLTKEHK